MHAAGGDVDIPTRLAVLEARVDQAVTLVLRCCSRAAISVPGGGADDPEARMRARVEALETSLADIRATLDETACAERARETERRWKRSRPCHDHEAVTA